tara:strand:- start:2837 stop:3277 length:441 start_codon:yes stop_codon:yes gene_type:complete
MMFKKYALIFLFLIPALGEADNAYDFGDYVVYYNAFTADTLPPQMATAYGILRSKYKGVLNISVQKKQNPGKLPLAVNALVKVEAVNLVGQLKELDTRKVTEGEAIYYISEFRISNKEQVKFKISLRPEGESRALEFDFSRQFYID